MCGRYSLAVDYNVLEDRFSFTGGEQSSLGPRYNIAPTQEVLTVVAPPGMGNEPRMMRWGLIPFWAKDSSIGKHVINARAETVSVKPSFRKSFQRRRCLVVADGFYEWGWRGMYRVPMRISLATGEPFGFAGVWEGWKSPDGEVFYSCAIITTLANAMMKSIHDRMPVIVPRQSEAVWLDPGYNDTGELTRLLGPYPSAQMDAYEVSSLINSPTNDNSKVLARVV